MVVALYCVSSFLHIGSPDLPPQPQLQSLLWLPWEVRRSERETLFHILTISQSHSHLYSGPRRVVLSEESLVNLVHGGEVVDVGQVDCGFDDVLEGCPGQLEMKGVVITIMKMISLPPVSAPCCSESGRSGPPHCQASLQSQG